MKKLGLAISSAVVLLAFPTGTRLVAAADAVVIRDTVTTPIFETGLPDDCRPGLTGTIVGTDVVDYQSVETAGHFHIALTDTGTARIDWSDGSYSIVESVDHQSFNTGLGTTVFNTAHQDSGNTYSADGVFLFRLTFHIEEHFTVTDGVVRAEFAIGRLHFFGDC
jgi:hypothetical protein